MNSSAVAGVVTIPDGCAAMFLRSNFSFAILKTFALMMLADLQTCSACDSFSSSKSSRLLIATMSAFGKLFGS